MIRCLTFFTLVCCSAIEIHAQNAATFDMTVAEIMRDPKWIGTSPYGISWSEDSRQVYFYWNPEKAEEDSLYVVSRDGGTPRKVTLEERKRMPSASGTYNRAKSQKVYEKYDDLFLLDIENDQIQQITRTVDRESNARFTHDERKVSFLRDNNLYLWHRDTGETVQMTDFRKGEEKPDEEEPKTEQERWIKAEEQALIQVLKERKERRDRREAGQEMAAPNRPKEIYVGDKRATNIRLSPDERYVTFRLDRTSKNDRRTLVPNYVTDAGFTEDLNVRTKVGRPGTTYEFMIYDIPADTVYAVTADSIPGIYDRPAYMAEEATGSEEETGEDPAPRQVIFHGPFWSDDGRRAAMVLLSLDNKDRWIMSLDPATGTLALLDHQRDEAWIGGPGIFGRSRAGSIGWMPDNRRVWFQSEESGYSHLYAVDAVTGQKTALTAGTFEVRDARISHDKKTWYFVSNQVHPGERHFYSMPIDGGRPTQITKMTGGNQVTLSPYETMLAVRYSSSNRPWELYLMENDAGAEPRQITRSLSDEFLSYPWRTPEIITFEARDKASVYARLYRPERPEPNGPAVIFVHGAGYLQNVHKWWSGYFREYMFHNLLVDNGYTVLDIDYRASAGYGRDWRTAIYRHMGGKDLTDNVDGAKFLVDQYDVDPGRIGIYGGSYGGFITLMALFTEPGVFAAGAALRPVTDWAHYNHGYTSNILNVPYADSLAYARSSPIYHAEGLQGALLICHGMIDTNVHFQDVVRLTQRLIELGKDDWEVALYPLEGHGFREPSSWTDEYKRIYKLFETHLK